MEYDKASSDEGNPTNFNVDKVGEDNGMQGTDYKVGEENKRLKSRERNLITDNRISYAIEISGQTMTSASYR